MTSRDPILAHKRIAPGDGYRVPRVFKVHGGLHYIKGNAKPCFSLTYWAHRVGFPNQCESGGAGHDEIERHFPGRFTDLAALHLCDIDGVPSHAVANGWYWLAGSLGGAGEEYHGGNSYRKPTRDECLATFAKLWRLTPEEAENFRSAAISKWANSGDTKRVKMMLEEEATKALPRWKAEAEACIAKHGLVVYGDEWEA